jgi:hypothetical protein
MQKICPQCGNDFTSRADNHVYCREYCKRVARDRRRGIEPMRYRSWKPGQRFGRLVLVEYRSGAGRQIWSCDCDCGTTSFEARSDKLKSGRQQSCGCLLRENNQKALERRREEKKELDAIRLVSLASLKAKQEQKSKVEATKWAKDKHRSLKNYLAIAGVPSTDPLWSLSYYSEIIKDGCVYCRGSLDSKSSSLGEINPSGLYDAANVVAECQYCRDRSLWNDTLAFHERALLGQTMELIRLQRQESGYSLHVRKSDLI